VRNLLGLPRARSSAGDAMKCPLCNGLSGEPPSVRVVLPFRNIESALIETRPVTICWVCAGEIAEEVDSLLPEGAKTDDEEDGA